MILRDIFEKKVDRYIEVDYDKPFLADEQDMEQYLAALKKAVIKAIHEGKRVRL